MVTLTKRGQKTVHLEEQNCYAELSRKPILGFPVQLAPPEIKDQSTHFMQAVMGRSESTFAQGPLKTNRRASKPRKTHSRGIPIQDINCKLSKNQDVTITESLNSVNALYKIEGLLPLLIYEITQKKNHIVNLP